MAFHPPATDEGSLGDEETMPLDGKATIPGDEGDELVCLRAVTMIKIPPPSALGFLVYFSLSSFLTIWPSIGVCTPFIK